MIPLRCDTDSRSSAPATILLILTCIVVYVFQGKWQLLSTGFVPLDFFHALFHPGDDLQRMAVNCTIAFFMHANILHLVSNMWYMWIFGAAVEHQIGTIRFFMLYLLCGAIAMFSQALYSPLSTIPVIGASGAIAGVMGLHFVLLPLSKILVWIPIVFFVRVPAFIFLLIWFVIQYISAQNGAGSSVAWWAHIGGFVTGAVWGGILRFQKLPVRGKQRSSKKHKTGRR